MYKVIAIAPTVYQLSSVNHFGPAVKQLGGSYRFEKEFESEEQAKDYLIERAKMYFDEEAELNEAISDIESCGRVRMDAVSGGIEFFEDEE